MLSVVIFCPYVFMEVQKCTYILWTSSPSHAHSMSNTLKVDITEFAIIVMDHQFFFDNFKTL